MKYKCSTCGDEHEGLPAIGFLSPYYFQILEDDEQENIAELSSDFCTIRHEEQTDRFIRGVLVQKLTDSHATLEYGVWVSLSETSFLDYEENFDSENHQVMYFGWLATQLPDYEDTLEVKTNVITRTGNDRPLIEVQESNDFENPFVRDYFEGITEAEALRRVQNIL